MAKQSRTQQADELLNRLQQAVKNAENLSSELQQKITSIEALDNNAAIANQKIGQISIAYETFQSAIDGKIEEIETIGRRITRGSDTEKSLIDQIQEAAVVGENLVKRINGDDDGQFQDKPSINREIESARKSIVDISEELDDTHAKATDHGIVSAFTGIADKADRYSKTLVVLNSILLLGIGSASILAILGIRIPLAEAGQYFEIPPIQNLEQLFLRIPFAIPFILLSLLLNREIKISRATSEIYKYKSSIANALKGYRNLYQLDHRSDEFMELFDVLKTELLRNPMIEIRKHLDARTFWEKDIRIWGWNITEPTPQPVKNTKEQE